MSGIPVYTSSPINAAQKPSAVTPQTAVPASQASDGSYTSRPAPSTTTLTSSTSYPPAQPGAPATPAPTGAAAQRYAPLQPTPTTKNDAEDNGPPLPQPGAAASMSNVPPPPKAGEKYNPPQQTSSPKASGSVAQSYPHQMGIPPPTTTSGGYSHTSTSTSRNPSSAYPVSLPQSGDGAARRSLEHPPGYYQNVYASDLTSEQRRAMEFNNDNTSRASTEKPGGEDGEGVWNTLGKMASQAGAKIAETEAGIWRSINKEK